MTLIDEDASPRGRRWFAALESAVGGGGWHGGWRACGSGRRPRRRGWPGGENRALPARAPALRHDRRLPGRRGRRPRRAGAGFRRSANADALELMQALLEEGAGTITFCKARVVAELITSMSPRTCACRRTWCDACGRTAADICRRERREIEAQLFSGELLGVCSTNALELGIDVGALDAGDHRRLSRDAGAACGSMAGPRGRRARRLAAIYVAYRRPWTIPDAEPGFRFRSPVERRSSIRKIHIFSRPSSAARRSSCRSRRTTSCRLGRWRRKSPGARDEGRLRLAGAPGAVADSEECGTGLKPVPHGRDTTGLRRSFRPRRQTCARSATRRSPSWTHEASGTR